MSGPRAVDLFCGAGGVSVGLSRAGFDVVAAVDLREIRCHRGGRFVQGDALAFELPDDVDFVWASPPCQAYTVLRSLHKGKSYPDLVAPTLAKLSAWADRQRGLGRLGLWCVENVPGSPLQPQGGNPLVLLCGSMFGLQTPDGSAELRRHRWFACSWPVALRPVCCHGGFSVSVVGHDASTRRRALTVTGSTPQINLVHNRVRKTYSVAEARVAMGVDWDMPREYLRQAIPPVYAQWIAERALEELRARGQA